MDEKELRIGNWVEYPLIGFKKIRAGEDIDDISDNAGMPIPLSPEILEKAGFEKDSVGYFNNGIYCMKFNNNTCKWSFGEWYMGQFCEIKYLHQLQNLYFALTGEELNINL